LLNPIDGNSYLAKMYQGWQGEWHFTLPYTAQPGKGAYLFLFYIFLGHLARLARLPLLVVFHLARLVSAFVLVLTIRCFLFTSFSTIRQTGLGTESVDSSGDQGKPCELIAPSPVLIPHTDAVFGLAILGLGLGWLAFPFGVITSDLWIPEAYPFLSAYANPHFALGLALLLWLLALPSGEGISGRASVSGLPARTPASRMRQEICSGIPIGLVSFFLSVVYPFGVIVALVVLGGLAAWELGDQLNRTRRHNPELHSSQQTEPDKNSDIKLRWIWVLLFGAPLLLYDWWVVRINPVLAGWNAQNLTPTPPPWDLLLSFSPALLLGLFGVIFLWYRRDRRFRLPLTWVVAAVILIYLPFGLQRRFMMGLFVPVVSLAGLVLAQMEIKKRRLAWMLGKLVLLLSLPTTLLVVLIGDYGVQAHDPLLYLTRGESQALKWIEEITPEDALILASPETGLFIPAHTGRRVIYGHPYETVNAETEKQAVIRFFQEAKDNEPYLETFLSERQVDYVFYGPRERKLGSLPQIDSLIPVFSTNDVEVYQYQR